MRKERDSHLKYRDGTGEGVRSQEGDEEVGEGVEVEQGRAGGVIHLPHRLLQYGNRTTDKITIK